MSKILGLDLGVTSIGWAVTEETEKNKAILGLGSRIIPLSPDDKDEFASGNKISKNQKRTTKRTQRKGYDRYQQRREKLKKILSDNDMFPDSQLFKLDAVSLFGLRDKALKEKISLKETGRILYHLNQKRGYKSSRSDANLDKKDTEYVAEVKNRHLKIKESGLTIGQYFFYNISQHQQYRVKEQIFPREAYLEEFDAVINTQKEFHPQLTEQLISKLRDEIIYYQRKLKSQKGLVSTCEFEGFYTKDKNGKVVFAGPKVTPRSSPIFQVCKIWETINTITLKNKRGEAYNIPADKKHQLFEYLDNHEKLSQAELFKILELKKEDGWYGNKQLAKGLQGNLTKTALLNKLKDLEHTQTLLQFNLSIESTPDECFLIDKKTGEVTATTNRQIVSSNFHNEPLYNLWHTIYSVADLEDCTTTLQSKFHLPANIAYSLAHIDFTKAGFGNKSAKAIRKILPYLIQGYVYSDACSFAGYNHSNSLTAEENIKRQLLDNLPNLPKNSLRQPVVEKILNQMINVVNAIIEKYGKPDEIRIELARELKQSKDERNETFANLAKRERENDNIRKRIENDYGHLGIRATRNNIIKWRLFHEINNEESKINGICIYCGQPFGITDALSGNLVDIEHIIPKSRLFDDSQSNKTLSHRKCNADKGDRTAYDFMKSKSNETFQQYLETVNSLYYNGIIGKAKRDKLLMAGDKIPQDFIDRQLRETQYISRKAREILQQVCYNVWSTSGSVTEYLRRVWGWNDVLMNLQLPKYRQTGLTEWKEISSGNGQVQKKEIIKDWGKRDDHRHHAIDALTIACTRQGYIQRINTLNASSTRDAMRREIEAANEYDNRKNLLENYFFTERPFTTAQLENEAAKILVSFKSGKKVATPGKRKIKLNGRKQVVQSGIIVPRGALSEESVYGKIKTIEKEKPIKYLFENPHLIYKNYIKSLVEDRLAKHNNNPKAAIASLKKETIYLDENKTIPLQYATCYKDQYVIKYPIESIKAKDLDSIIDKRVREIIKERLEQYENKEKEAFKNIEENPVWYNVEKKIPIKTVRCFTGLSAVEPVKRNNEGKEIGFVKPGNNHHIAFYTNENGKKQEHVCSFWHAVERKKYNIPVIIKNPQEVWDRILENQSEYPQSFLDKLPEDKWQFEESLQQNEMFVMGLSNEEVEKHLSENNLNKLSHHLYRVQKITSSDYWFRHHLETSLNDSETAKESRRFYRLKSIGSLEKLNPIKIIINHLGEIVRK